MLRSIGAARILVKAPNMGVIKNRTFLTNIRKAVEDRKKPVVAVINLHGTIQAKQGGLGSKYINIDTKRKEIDKAFAKKKLEAVFLSINSPGGSAVQSDLVASYIQEKAKLKNTKVISFVEDTAASGGYWLACAGQEIYAARSSVVGSIGVIFSGLGLHELINKHGIERRTYTGGENKAILDPFAPTKEKDVQIIKNLITNIHNHFIDHVKTNRGSKLKGEDNVLFSGEFWTGQTAVDLGLIDGVEHMDSYITRVYGEKVRVERSKPGGLSGMLTGVEEVLMQQRGGIIPYGLADLYQGGSGIQLKDSRLDSLLQQKCL